ncbi:putative ribonuclease H-like domain-containing protein [Tanacetum coccineum]
MQEGLLQFKLQKVWTLVDLPKEKRAIGTKWVYKNKKDNRGIVVRNKARLVVQGYTQEKGIDYDEVFAPVARIKAIRLFLAHASFVGLITYQMDVKSAFLYGTIEEEVYVCQPPSFEDLQFHDKVYKVEKALYGLHQAPRAWYETLSTYLLENGYKRGTIDKTLFIKKDRDDAQEIPDEFYGGAHFLFRIATSTPIETNKALNKDEETKDVDVYLYRLVIGSLMYLTAFRPDIMFVVCACARFQITPKVSHLHAVKRIFRYLKVIMLELALTGNPQQVVVNFLAKDETVYKEWEDRMERAATTASSLEAKQDNGNINRTQSMATLNESFPQGTGSSSGTRFNLLLPVLVYAARHSLTTVRRVTPLFSTMIVQAIENMGADSATPIDSHSTPIITQPSSSKPQKKKSRRKQRKDSVPTEPTTEETTPKEHVSTPSYDPLPSGEDRMQLVELMSLCTNLQENVLDWRKPRLLKVESSNDASLGAPEDASKQGRKIEDLDADAEVTLVNETQEMNDDNLMFDTGMLEKQEIKFKKVVKEPVVSVAITTKSIPVSAAEVVTTASASVVILDELTLAQTLIEIKTAKPKPVTTAVGILNLMRQKK